MKVRIKMKKATNLIEVLEVCKYYPLDTEDLSQFYIDTTEARGTDMIARLKLVLSYFPDTYQQVLYMGHSGSGKSTVLYQLENSLIDIYKVIRFSVQESLDINNIELVDLIFSMYESLLNEFESSLDDDELFNEIYEKWYSIVSKESTEQNDFSLEAGAGVDVGVKSKLFSLFMSIKSSMKIGTAEKQIIRTEVNKNITNYIEQFNRLVRACESKSTKPILFMVEDLEKLTSTENARDIFVSKSSYFRNIHCRMLLTAPIYLKYTYDFNDSIVQNFAAIEMCPMIAVSNFDNTKCEVGIDTLKKIVYARINDELIDNQSLEKAIVFSGGVLRDLFTILTQASLQAKVDNREQISESDIDFGIKKLQEMIECSLRHEHLDLIKTVYKHPQGLIRESNEFLNLMRTRIIIEYNGKQWRGVHPAVINYIRSNYLIDLDN